MDKRWVLFQNDWLEIKGYEIKEKFKQKELRNDDLMDRMQNPTSLATVQIVEKRDFEFVSWSAVILVLLCQRLLQK